MGITLKGLATVAGVNGTTTWSAIIGDSALETMGADVTDKADVTRRLDKNGEVKGFMIRGGRKEVTVTLLATVTAAGKAYSEAKKSLKLPPPCTVVTLSAFESGYAPGAADGINGDYIYEEGGSISYQNDWVKLTLPLWKPDYATATDLTAAVPATP